MDRAATTASSLEAEQDSGIINRTQSTDVQALEIQKLKKRVKRLEKKRKLRTPQLKRSKQVEDAEIQGRYGYDIEVNTASTSITTASINLTAAEPVTTVSAPITIAGVSVSTAEPSTPPPKTTTLIENEDLIIAQTLMKIRSVKSKEKSKEKRVSSTRLTRGVIMKEDSETASRPTLPPQKFKAQMQAVFKEEERVARQREEEANLMSWDNTQPMMEADYELA
nr:hypothetical protein [Tanacetum cinerariifolium]